MTDLLSNIFTNLPPLAMPRFGLSAILDIAFITFVLYRILMWVKQTRAWSLFKGVLIILVIWLVAATLLMETTRWIIEQAAPIAAIVLAIIFQPELRKGLESIGKTRHIAFLAPLQEQNHTLSADTIEEIVTATQKMASVKTGALIVIEQKEALGVESSGVPIDAVVSSQLLINIFEHNTPLHDGAVLVRENRIKAACCILPLTDAHLSGDLGTRHRAAVGTSETSDAYVLVVSEETGRISIAKDGKLYLNLSDVEIRKILLENMNPKKARRFRPHFRKGKK